MISNSLMRIMAVRSARNLDVTHKTDLSIPLKSEFLNQVQNAPTKDQLRSICNEYVTGKQFPTYGAKAKVLEILVNGHKFFSKETSSNQSDEIKPADLKAFQKTISAEDAKLFKNPLGIAIWVSEAIQAATYSNKASKEMRMKLQLAARTIGIMSQLVQNKPVSKKLLSAPVILPSVSALSANPHDIRPAGIGDLLIVKDEWLSYERDEIAHIENVMASETRKRNHRLLDRTTQVITTETEKIEESTRDLQTTEKSELSSQMDETISSAMALSTGVNISASYGPVLSVDSSADFSYDTSREEAKSVSSNFAQEMVDKSISKLYERRKDSTSITTVKEIEEINAHEFTNTNEDADHIVGVYRYVTQEWEAQILNYGKRLLFEFIVPEPAANYLQAHSSASQKQAVLSEPKTFNLSPSSITSRTYLNLVRDYKATDVSPPPDAIIYIDTTIEIAEDYHGKLSGNDYNVKTHTASQPIPEGYMVTHVTGESSKGTFLKDNNDREPRLDVIAGNRRLILKNGHASGSIDNIRETVDIAVYCFDVTAAAIHLEFKCTRTSEALVNWQLETFDKLRIASQQEWAAYNAEQALLQNQNSSYQNAIHPDKKRTIEKEELKRGALTLLTQQSFENYDAVNDPLELDPNQTVHEIDIDEAFRVAPDISFFEQCFEWEQMTYLFYPYFWGDKKDWLDKLRLSDNDNIFESFLKAGSSRVQIPVRPGFEKAIMFYLATGLVWGGRDTPVIGSPLYVPIVQEIAESKDVALAQADPYGEKWKYQTPTNLIVLDPDASLVS